MIAPKVAKGACDLEPKSIQMPELQYWVIRAHALRKAYKSSCSNNSNPVYSGVRDPTKLNFSIRLASTFAQRVRVRSATDSSRPTEPGWPFAPLGSGTRVMCGLSSVENIKHASPTQRRVTELALEARGAISRARI
jgi:hypothetical protein